MASTGGGRGEAIEGVWKAEILEFWNSGGGGRGWQGSSFSVFQPLHPPLYKRIKTVI